MAPVKGGWCSLEVHKESLEWEALGRVMGEQLWDLGALIYLGSTTIFLERAGPSQGKINHLAL